MNTNPGHSPLSAQTTALVPASAAKPGPVRAGSSSIPSAGALLKALRRRWLSATTCGLLALVAGGLGAWFGMPVKYTASALFQVAAHEPRVLGSDLPAPSDFMVYQKSQAALVTSRLVLNTVLKDPEVAGLGILPRNADQQIDWMQQEIKVDFKTGPELMRISLQGERPQEMKTLLNAVARAYFKEVVNKERSKKQARLNQLKEIQSKFEETLRNRREAVRSLILALGSGDAQVLAVKQRYATEALGITEKELLQVQSDLRRLKLELKSRSEDKPTAPEVPQALVEQALSKDPAIIRLVTLRESLENQLDEGAKTAVLGRNEPAFAPLVNQLKMIDRQLKTTRARLIPEIKESLRLQARGEGKSSSVGLRERIGFYEDLEKSLLDSVERLRKQTVSTNAGQADVESFRLEISQAEKLAERVASEVETLKVEVDAPRRVELIEEASVSDMAQAQKRLKLTAGVALGALVLVVGLICWREASYRRLQSADDLVTDLGLPVVGALPHFPATGRSLVPWQGSAKQDWDHLAECIDATRTSLLHRAREKNVQVILVTSALGGEGKTSLSCHLAVSLARAGFRTLLIDGDMRRPAVHHVLKVSVATGLSELLRHEAALPDAIHATTVDRLWMIGAGQWSEAATAALARARLPELLTELRQQFEYIIIDSAPLLPVVDSLLLGQHADGVVLSVLREVSQVPPVSRAAERLGSVGVRILGVVVNGVSLDVNAYRYGYGASRGGNLVATEARRGDA